MNLKTRALVAAAGVGILTLGISLPASAETVGTTGATVTVEGGVLAISVPISAGNLGTRANTVDGGTISGLLGVVKVSDARSADEGSGWVTSVRSTDFAPLDGPAIAASYVGYTAGSISGSGTATYVTNDPADLSTFTPAVTANGITANNSASWNPTINVKIPGGTVAAVYSATITHSVA